MGPKEDHTEGGTWEVAASGALLAAGLLAKYLDAGQVSYPLLLLSMVVAGFRVAKFGLLALFHLRITIALLMTIAAAGAFAIGELEEGAAVLFLFNLAERLEDYAADRARSAIKNLLELKPEVAVVKRNGGEVSVPVDQVLPGDVVVVRPGDRFPLDGVIIGGATSVDESSITGESFAVFKDTGDPVYAGTINVDGFLSVRVTRFVEESMLSRIIQLVEEAEERRSATETFVDRFSRFYTPTVVLLAVVVALVPPLFLGQSLATWTYRAIVMLVVSCPCALAISTPVAMVSAITSAGRNGVLIKGSAYLEQVSMARAFAFDKTGTLTRGIPAVTDIVAFGLPEREVLRRAATLETMVDHPLATAIVERARAEGIDIAEARDFKAYAGRGVEACIADKTCCVGSLRLFKELGIAPGDGVVDKLESEGKTVVLVSEGDCAVGAIALMDEVRADAAETLARLKQRSLRVVMLTGDNEPTARAIAAELGIDEYSAHLLPEEKVDAIERLKKTLAPVVMVGDGVNDAPALAAADVGVAMGAIGSDVALEAADIALMGDELGRLPYLVDLSKATMRRIRENILASLLVKASVGVLALYGAISLWMAVAVGDMGLSLAVIFNSLRLSAIRSKS